MRAEVSEPKQRRSLRQFLTKYFLEGQSGNKVAPTTLRKLHDNADFLDRFVERHRRAIGILLPLGIFHVVYWIVFFRFGLFEVVKRRFPIIFVMVFGGFIGGATTVGGGAVAYPALTLGFNTTSTLARDYSLMIQACGLSIASCSIFFIGVPVEWRSLVFSSAGAVPGLILSLHFFDPLLGDAQKKMIFVSFFFAFALALFFRNLEKKSKTLSEIPNFTVATAIILFAAGVIGGAFTGIAGSGINIFAFSVLTLLFRISEKVATPTAVVLMAVNSIVAFFWRAVVMNDIQAETWEYFSVSVIAVATFAPLGSLFASIVHRQTLAVLVYVLQTVTLISALLIVPLTGSLIALTVGVIVVAFGFYFLMSKIGARSVKEECSTITLQTSASV